MKKFRKIFLIIILFIVFFILGFVANNYLFNEESSQTSGNESVNNDSQLSENENVSTQLSENNNTSTQVSEDAPIDVQLSESDKEQLENLYLRLFISINKDTGSIGIFNNIAYCFNIQSIEDNGGSELFLKEDVDNIAKKLFGEKSDVFLSRLAEDIEFDSQRKSYILYGNDEYIPYSVKINALKRLKNNNIQATIQFYQFSEGDYYNFIETYENEHNITLDENSKNKLIDLHEDTQPKINAEIEFKELDDDVVKYQFVKMSYADTNNIVLYKGLDISCIDLELSIPYTDENKENYEITYYNYENGKFLGESKGKLKGTYDGVAKVSNTKKIALSQKYDAIPRKYTTIENIPDELSEYADNNKVELQAIDLDGDNNLEYVLAYSSFTSPEDYDVEEYTNYSEILVLDSNFNKIETLASARDQFWEHDGIITDEFFLSLDDVEYIDIDNDNNMEILLDTNVYEGIDVNIYKYKNGIIAGNINDTISALP